MSGIRWKVEQEFNWLNGTYWIAWRPSEGWKGLAPKFHTHAEALAYADQQARTVELALPRVRNQREIVTNGYRSFISRKASGRIWLESEGVSFCILPEEAESFAQTILALHYHYERNLK